MDKAGRFVCIFTPMALTIASLVCLIFIEISGLGGQHGELNDYYFVKANFTDLKTSGSGIDQSSPLTTALATAKQDDLLDQIYEIHLWNYCAEVSASAGVTYCTSRSSDFYFNPITAWGFNNTNGSTSAEGGSSSNPISSEISKLQNETSALETTFLGKAGHDALDAYRDVSHWMIIAYEISFVSTALTIVVGIFAIFSRWGSFFTWILAVISSIFTLAAVLTSTIVFSILVATLRHLLDPYDVDVSLGTHALAVTWLSVIFSWAATLFWLFSICCCSGRSNPHHRSNKGGLWNAEPKGQGYGDYYGGAGGRGRGMRVEKTGGSGAMGPGGGYERVASPFNQGGAPYGERVPLSDYPQHTGFAQQQQHPQGSGAYEPFRHQGA